MSSQPTRVPFVALGVKGLSKPPQPSLNRARTLWKTFIQEPYLKIAEISISTPAKQVALKDESKAFLSVHTLWKCGMAPILSSGWGFVYHSWQPPAPKQLLFSLLIPLPQPWPQDPTQIEP